MHRFLPKKLTRDATKTPSHDIHQPTFDTHPPHTQPHGRDVSDEGQENHGSAGSEPICETHVYDTSKLMLLYFLIHPALNKVLKQNWPQM